MDTPYQRLGAERLRAVVDDFVDRVIGDVMIGFFFRDVDRVRLKELEFQHAAEFLGAPEVRYAGRPLATAHRRHPIMGGQFSRRLQILRETLQDHAIPGDIADAWLEHNASLRAQITRDASGECDPRPA